MEDVIAKASELGRTLCAAPEFLALREAEAAVMASPDSVTLAEALGTLHQRRAADQAAGRPMDAATAETIGKITAAVAIDERLQALSRAQQAFQALVDRVNRAMLAELRPAK